MRIPNLDGVWLLAMLAFFGAFVIQIILLISGGGAMPAWIVAVVAAVVTHYFNRTNGRGQSGIRKDQKDEDGEGRR